MKITISGRIGAGKSTVAKKLSKLLGYKYYSTGEIMRSIANKRGISLLDLSKYAEKDPTIDKQIDDFQKKIGKVDDNFVMDSRLGFYFIPDSIKIYLNISIDTSAERIINRKNSEENFNDFDDVVNSITERENLENERFKSLYHIDFTDLSNYDLIIDTDNLNVDQVVSLIISFLQKMKLLTKKEMDHIEKELINEPESKINKK